MATATKDRRTKGRSTAKSAKARARKSPATSRSTPTKGAPVTPRLTGPRIIAPAVGDLVWAHAGGDENHEVGVVVEVAQLGALVRMTSGEVVGASWDRIEILASQRPLTPKEAEAVEAARKLRATASASLTGPRVAPGDIVEVIGHEGTHALAEVLEVGQYGAVVRPARAYSDLPAVTALTWNHVLVQVDQTTARAAFEKEGGAA